MQKKKNWIKIIIFVCIVTGILMLNHHYGWSSYLGDMSNLMFLKTMVEENIVAALALYIIITIVGCVVICPSGRYFCSNSGNVIWPDMGEFCLPSSNNSRCNAGILVGKFF